MIPKEWFEQAQERLRGYILRTPLTYDPERNLYLKWENRQITGSFKVRGALNKVLCLEAWEREAGLVAASAGNHGQGVALAARLTHARAEVFVPAHAVQSKVEAIRQLGAEVCFIEGGYAEAERAAVQYAAERGRIFISPYNDGQIIAGQGTIALEIVGQLKEKFDAAPKAIRAWILPVGGGGLIAGCGAALAGIHARSTLIGVQPGASAFTHSLFHNNTQRGVRDDPTLADGLSGAIDETSITLPMLRALAADLLTVSEEDIERAIALAWWCYGERIEGSAAAALAAALNRYVEGERQVVVLTGGNIEAGVFRAIAARHREGAID